MFLDIFFCAPGQATLTDADQRTLHELNTVRIPALNAKLKTEFDALEVASAARTRLLSILSGNLQKRREVCVCVCVCGFSSGGCFYPYPCEVRRGCWTWLLKRMSDKFGLFCLWPGTDARLKSARVPLVVLARRGHGMTGAREKTDVTRRLTQVRVKGIFWE